MVEKTVSINDNIASQSAAMEEINANIEELSAMSETFFVIVSMIRQSCEKYVIIRLGAAVRGIYRIGGRK